MPAGRSRDGPGQEVGCQQGWLASRQGHPGIVPKRQDRPHLRGHGREHGMDTDKRRPAGPGRGSGDHRNLNPAINPIILRGRHL